MTIKRENVVMMLAYNIAWERWGERGHEPGCWDYATAESSIKILQEAGYDIIKIETPTNRPLVVMESGQHSGEPRVYYDEFSNPPGPRWAEADDVPWPGGPVNGDTMASDYAEDVTRAGTLGGES